MKSLFKIFILLVLSVSILTGCWDQKIFEEIGLVLSAGIEESKNQKLLLTYVYPIIGGKEKDSVGIESAESSLLRGAREKIRYRAPKRLEGGKTQQILISDGLAKQGIHDILEIFQRDVALPAIAYVVVVEGSPNELLNKGSALKNKPRISFYTFQLLEDNEQLSNIPNTKVFDFDINYFAPGLDPVTPLIKLQEEYIEIIGCALFSEDKMVGKLDNRQAIMLLGMMGQAKNSDFVFDDPKFSTDNPINYGIAVTLRKPKRKIKIDFDEAGIPVIDVSLKYTCLLDEYKWNETNDPVEQKKIEKALSSSLTKYANETIRVMQEVNSDPIGFGNIIRAKYHEYWKNINWKEVYPEAQIKVDVQLEIIKEGIIK